MSEIAVKNINNNELRNQVITNNDSKAIHTEVSSVGNLSLKVAEKTTNNELANNKLNDKKEINEKTLDSLQKQLNTNNLKLNYYKDNEGHNIMEIRDVETDEVIRQVPSKEQIVIADAIDSFLSSYNSSGMQEKPKTSILNSKAN